VTRLTEAAARAMLGGISRSSLRNSETWNMSVQRENRSAPAPTRTGDQQFRNPLAGITAQQLTPPSVGALSSVVQDSPQSSGDMATKVATTLPCCGAYSFSAGCRCLEAA